MNKDLYNSVKCFKSYWKNVLIECLEHDDIRRGSNHCHWCDDLPTYSIKRTSTLSNNTYFDLVCEVHADMWKGDI